MKKKIFLFTFSKKKLKQENLISEKNLAIIIQMPLFYMTGDIKIY